MCGIVAAHGIDNPAPERSKYLTCSKKIRHRGPDWSGCYVGKRSILAHERLAIVGVGEHALIASCLCFTDPAFMTIDSGAQPLISDDGKLILAVNGEIYNHKKLHAEVPSYQFKTHSDCEIIIPLVCLLLYARLSSILSDIRGPPVQEIRERALCHARRHVLFRPSRRIRYSYQDHCLARPDWYYYPLPRPNFLKTRRCCVCLGT